MIDLSELPRRFLLIALAALLSAFAIRPAHAATGSRCIALAQNTPGVRLVSLTQTAAPANEVSIAFVGHGGFRIETSGGVVIATDYSGYAGKGRAPDVVTMNHAHPSHYTDFPDPQIKHVLRGWGTVGFPAKCDLGLAMC